MAGQRAAEVYALAVAQVEEKSSYLEGGTAVNDLQKTTLVRAINHFGVEAQTEKALEEMGELITELSRRHSSRGDKEKIAEEVADALVVLEQLRIIYGGERVDGFVAKKLSRLEKRMNEDGGICNE